MASANFRDSLNSLGWSRRDPDLPVNTSVNTPILGRLQSLNPFGQGGYVRLPTTETNPGAPLPAPTRREEEEGWFACTYTFYPHLPCPSAQVLPCSSLRHQLHKLAFVLICSADLRHSSCIPLSVIHQPCRRYSYEWLIYLKSFGKVLTSMLSSYSESMGSLAFVRRPHDCRSRHVCNCFCIGAYWHLHPQAAQIRRAVSHSLFPASPEYGAKLSLNSFVAGPLSHVPSKKFCRRIAIMGL
jgi:hypothetical protein